MYSQKVSEKLRGFGVLVGDRIKLAGREGILMPKPEAGDPECIVVKLDSGYNIGIMYEEGMSVEKLEGRAELEKPAPTEVKFDEDKPLVSILMTGGTIAARVDYRTGGVVPAFTASDVVSAVPELARFAKLRCKSVMNVFSENIRPEHYKYLAGAIASEISDGAKGIVILHGTDTMHYTSAMLSFMLGKLPVPVVLVGAQRSSDRGSSDAAMNLICGVNFAANADCSGVYVCMHGGLDDKDCHVHLGTRVRKMHTSRRDAFKSIDIKPVAKVNFESGEIVFAGSLPPKGGDPVDVASALEEKVAMLKIYPGISHEQVSLFRENGFKGVVLEGTGLGHMPCKGDGENGGENELVFKEVKALCESGCVVVMTSQCIYGDVNLNVYSTGRDLEGTGVISGHGMLPETAYVKLMWLLGNVGAEKTRELMTKNIAGEIVERREISADFES
ncbi:MAG: Glu-tRNA(Gln) amidotransferase subunit GatD [Candidatus Micrarchaeota archaeon]